MNEVSDLPILEFSLILVIRLICLTVTPLTYRPMINHK